MRECTFASLWLARTRVLQKGTLGIASSEILRDLARNAYFNDSRCEEWLPA